MADAIYPYQENANAFTAYETRVKLTALAKDWDSYFDHARAQTFADIALTTWIEGGHFKKGYLVGPPDRQWFALHPNFVLENVEAAPDGENSKISLSIEWIGVNWWQNSVIGIPFGVSLTSLYSDRAGVEDVGHGVTLYFDNKYAIGYANHSKGKYDLSGDAVGYYVSVDLLQSFESKTKQVVRYRDRISGILK